MNLSWPAISRMGQQEPERKKVPNLGERHKALSERCIAAF
jgi:hypothetical protein